MWFNSRPRVIEIGALPFELCVQYLSLALSSERVDCNLVVWPFANSTGKSCGRKGRILGYRAFLVGRTVCVPSVAYAEGMATSCCRRHAPRPPPYGIALGRRRALAD
jgi:hypothetical protein